MTPKRHIKVWDKETGKMLYEGDDKRTYVQDYSQKIFGMPSSDIIKLGVYFIMLIVFLVKSDARITKIEESQTLLLQAMQNSINFQRNSDSWHSTVLSTQFDNGKPANPNIDINRVKKNFLRGVDND